MMQMVWLLAFMLIPVWIPIIAVTTGAIFDRLRPSEPSELTRRMAALQAAPKALRQERGAGGEGAGAPARQAARSVVLSRRAV